MTTLIIFRGMFDVVFWAFSKYKPQLFIPLQNITTRYRNKFIYKCSIYLTLTIICALISFYLDISLIPSAMILAFSWSLTDTAFKESRHAKET